MLYVKLCKRFLLGHHLLSKIALIRTVS